VTPFPSFPQIQGADLGEGELRVGMKREIIDTKVQVRMVALREFSSPSPQRPLFQEKIALQSMPSDAI